RCTTRASRRCAAKGSPKDAGRCWTTATWWCTCSTTRTGSSTPWSGSGRTAPWWSFPRTPAAGRVALRTSGPRTHDGHDRAALAARPDRLQLRRPAAGSGRHRPERARPGQAAAAAEVLSRVQPVQIISSDLSRAHDTARTLGELVGVPVRLDQRLRERSFGRWEGLAHPESAEGGPEQYGERAGGEQAEGGGAGA